MNIPKSSELLSSIPFFKGLSTNELNEVGRIAFEKFFNKDEIIFSDGQRGDGSYLIIEGTVKVYKLSLHGKEHIFHFFSSGWIFGEVAVFYRRPLSFKRRGNNGNSGFVFSRIRFL